jgi:hypothetical protein
LWASFAFKQTLGLSLDLPLALPDLHRMNPIFLRYLIDGLHPTERLQSNLSLELRRMKFALL